MNMKCELLSSTPVAAPMNMMICTDEVGVREISGSLGTAN
jgi:hypothetical protein